MIKRSFVKGPVWWSGSRFVVVWPVAGFWHSLSKLSIGLIHIPRALRWELKSVDPEAAGGCERWKGRQACQRWPHRVLQIWCQLEAVDFLTWARQIRVPIHELHVMDTTNQGPWCSTRSTGIRSYDGFLPPRPTKVLCEGKGKNVLSMILFKSPSSLNQEPIFFIATGCLNEEESGGELYLFAHLSASKANLEREKGECFCWNWNSISVL